MKKEFIVSMLLLSFSNLGAQELPGHTPADGQFAVLKPQYSCEVNVPAGRSSAQVYFSKDCQTAYILPSLNMKKTILKPYFTADTGICQRFAQVKNSLSGIEAKINSLDEKIANTEAKLEDAEDEAVIKMLKDKITFFKSQKDTLTSEQQTRLDPYYDAAAVRTQIRVESDAMDEVAAFQAANLANVNASSKVYPVRFAPAQTTLGVLAISSMDTSKYRGRSVLKVTFPGVKYIPKKEDEGQFEPDATLINMNGSMSGIVDLSAVTYCSVIESRNTKVSTDEKDLIDIFNSAVALNYDFQVKVQAGVRVHMKSTLETRDFLSRMQDRVTNTAFTRAELIGTMVSGGVLNNLEIQLDDKGSQYDLAQIIFGNPSEDADDTKSLIAPLISKFIKSHLDRMESKLEQLGVLTTISEVRAKEIKASTTTEIGGYNSICSSSSSWFGLKKRQSCHSEPVYVQVNHDGISDLLKLNADNSSITDEMTIESNETTLVRHTSTFGKL